MGKTTLLEPDTSDLQRARRAQVVWLAQNSDFAAGIFFDEMPAALRGDLAALETDWSDDFLEFGRANYIITYPPQDREQAGPKGSRADFTKPQAILDQPLKISWTGSRRLDKHKSLRAILEQDEPAHAATEGVCRIEFYLDKDGNEQKRFVPEDPKVLRLRVRLTEKGRARAAELTR
jgi:hypothetical protein